MNNRETMRFFEELFLRSAFYWRHPPQRVWREYLAQASGDARLDLEEVLRWNDDRLQLHHHLLTCGRCARQVARLRREARPASLRLRPAWQFPRLVGYSVLATLLIAVGLWISIPHDSFPPDIHPPTSADLSPGGGLGGG